MRVRSALLLVLLLANGCSAGDPPAADAIASQMPGATIVWDALPHLPRPLSGHTTGLSHGALLVDGGTDFPVSLFDGGSKVWYDSVYVLEPGASAWRLTSTLPHRLAYAATASASNRILLAGGSDETRHVADAFALEWVDGTLRRTALPPLPAPLAMAGAAVVGQTLYVAGGHDAPASAQASNLVMALDLQTPDAGWQALPPFPGPGRILPVVVAQAGQLFVASGASLSPGANSGIVRHYLTDAYAWTPEAEATIPAAAADAITRGSWRRIADVPRAVTAAPAAASGQTHIIVFGGDDGTLADRVTELEDSHPGFSRDVLAYDVAADNWTSVGSMPEGLVTTAAVPLGDAIAIVGGEDRPGHRSASAHRRRPAQTSPAPTEGS